MEQGNNKLPAEEVESWFLNMVWGSLTLALYTEEALQFKHAEYSSPTMGKRWAIGRKADIVKLSTSTRS
jgi:hypothetical protein